MGSSDASDMTEEISREELEQKARASALRLLSYRARSERELTEKLCEKGFEPGVVEPLMEWLRELGYLNDALFARDLIATRIDNKLWGRMKIADELRRKGLAREIIDDALGRVTTEVERETAVKAFSRWLRRKGLQALPLERDMEIKAARHLASLGFGQGLVVAVIKDREGLDEL